MYIYDIYIIINFIGDMFYFIEWCNYFFLVNEINGMLGDYFFIEKVVFFYENLIIKENKVYKVVLY